MLEQISIAIIFVISVVYLINLVRKNFSPKTSGCASGCGACNTIDFKKIEAEIAKKELVNK
jgi:hypothetical protein